MRNLFIIFVSLLLISCSDRQPRRPVSVHTGTFLRKSAEKNKQLLNREEAIIDSVILKDSLHTYYTSKTGFRYRYKNQNKEKGYLPQEGDRVTFSYILSDIEGKVIYSEEENQIQTYLVDKQELFFGLRNAIKLLQENETGVFYFPSEIAFGYHGDNDRIGHNQPIVAEVTIHKIEKVK